MSAGSFSYSIKVASRKKGHNAVAHAAYIAGEALYDQRLDRYQLFAGQERVMAKQIDVPDNAPEWLREIQREGDRESLWNLAEAREGSSKIQGAYRTAIMPIDDGLFVRRDGEIDREASIALQGRLIAEHVRQFTQAGMAADWAIHWDCGFKNPHAHVILTRRLAMEEGFHRLKDGALKSGSRGKPAPRPWNDRKNAEKWRANWAEVQNKALKELDLPYRLDHRSYKRRGIQLLPEQKHYGRSQRKQANDRHHRQQVERLIKNPRPIFDAISQSYVRAFTAKDLQRYAARFSKGAGMEKGRELYESLLASQELIRLKGGLLLTQGLVAKQAQQDLESVLKNYRDIGSWKSLDEAVKKAGWRLEIVSRETRRGKRLAFDFAKRDDPVRRVSAYRVSTHFSPKKTREKFGESRVKHELRELGRRRGTYHRAFREEIWRDFKDAARLEREEFNQRYQAFRQKWEKRFAKRRPLELGEKLAYRASKWFWRLKRRRLKARQDKAYEMARRRSDLSRQAERERIDPSAVSRESPKAAASKQKSSPDSPPPGAQKVSMGKASIREVSAMNEQEYRKLLIREEQIKKNLNKARQDYALAMRRGDREAGREAGKRIGRLQDKEKAIKDLREKHERKREQEKKKDLEKHQARKEEKNKNKNKEKEGLHIENKMVLDEKQKSLASLQKKVMEAKVRRNRQWELSVRADMDKIRKEMIKNPEYDKWSKITRERETRERWEKEKAKERERERERELGRER